MTKKTSFTLAMDSGAVRLPVVRDGRPVGTLVLPVDDTAFLGRFYALLPRLEQQRADLTAALSDADAAVSLAALNAACETLRGEIDTVFGAGTSALVFGETCSLGMVQQFFAGVGEALRAARAPKLAAYTEADSAVLA